MWHEKVPAMRKVCAMSKITLTHSLNHSLISSQQWNCCTKIKAEIPHCKNTPLILLCRSKPCIDKLEIQQDFFFFSSCALVLVSWLIHCRIKDCVCCLTFKAFLYPAVLSATRLLWFCSVDWWFCISSNYKHFWVLGITWLHLIWVLL